MIRDDHWSITLYVSSGRVMFDKFDVGTFNRSGGSE